MRDEVHSMLIELLEEGREGVGLPVLVIWQHTLDVGCEQQDERIRCIGGLDINDSEFVIELEFEVLN